MARSMKVPVLIFEDIQEPSILLEALYAMKKKILLKSLSKENTIKLLIKELEHIIEIMEKTNIR